MLRKIKGERITRRVWMDGSEILPEKSHKIRNHSPDGFNWGYGGSGPAQLALAILLEVMSINEALAYHQDFKWEFIASLPDGNFEIEIDIEDWITRKVKAALEEGVDA
jgi:hypothetical protein